MVTAGTITFLLIAFISFLVYEILFYVYFSLSFATIGKKLGKDNLILAWIPIANIIFLLQCANRPWWWIFLLLIPFVNIVCGIIIWMDVAKNMNQPAWLGILTIIPVVQIFLPGYIAVVPKDKKDTNHPAPFIVLAVSLFFLFLAIGCGIGGAVGLGIKSVQTLQESPLRNSVSTPSSFMETEEEFLPNTEIENTHPNGDVEFW